MNDETTRTTLWPMPDEDGAVTEWYFDCDDHYIDVAKDAQGRYSIFFRDRVTKCESWLDQADHPALLERTAPLADHLPVPDPANTPQAFNDWWDRGTVTATNPFRPDSRAFWAWEGWQAAQQVPGLGRITNEDDGFITLQFVNEDAAQVFMECYLPSVDVRDMP